ncbi:hypothetical protein [Algicola sagamiensis]|uniref:hypothetical protein n=1 Tax=Algicola sagamiensis TaxID=163869 RepID=UPI0003A7981D|nr:hypothetical protein [Algicola sagamiensis]
MTDQLFIRAKVKPGFRRSGIYFPYEGVTIETATLSEEALKAIQVEQRLVIAEGNQEPIDDTPPAFLEEITEAIGMLNPEKKPNVKDVEAILKKDISGVQRDKAWQLYQERLEAL